MFWKILRFNLKNENLSPVLGGLVIGSWRYNGLWMRVNSLWVRWELSSVPLIGWDGTRKDQEQLFYAEWKEKKRARTFVESASVQHPLVEHEEHQVAEERPKEEDSRKELDQNFAVLLEVPAGHQLGKISCRWRRRKRIRLHVVPQVEEDAEGHV